MKRAFFLILMAGWVSVCRADISVTASVDQRQVEFGESLTYSITVEGATSDVNPALPAVDGLQFEGPSVSTSVQIVNMQMSRSAILAYRVMPQRVGEFTIPAVDVDVGGQKFRTEPITITVTQGTTPADTRDEMFGEVDLGATTLYLGQTVPVRVRLFARQNVPVHGISGFQCAADDLGFRYLPNLKQGTRTINGEVFRIFAVDGALTPTKTGKLTLGPSVWQVQVTQSQRRRSNNPLDDGFFDSFFNRVQVREVPVTVDAVSVEVLPLPAEGRPAGFAGAVGQWTLQMTAKPQAVSVGDPITVNVHIAGTGNIDLVPDPSLGSLDRFKTYDPSRTTTNNELRTEGARDWQQVLVPKTTSVKEIPAVHFSFFDPVTKQYQTVAAGPIPITVKPGGGGETAIVAGNTRLPSVTKLGEDIVYLKGDLGPRAEDAAMMRLPVFWTLNFVPVVALAGSVIWKRRRDKLRGDIAYARRSRAARSARKLLAAAENYEGVQHALQSYLGDRLNIPSSGITASVAEERALPAAVREIFETCDAARFAGASTDLAALKQTVERTIDELEDAPF